MRTSSYPSDVTDDQWALIEPLLPPAPTVRAAANGTLRSQMGTPNDSPAAETSVAAENRSSEPDDSANTPGPDGGRDPFDPDIFNRRFHGGR